MVQEFEDVEIYPRKGRSPPKMVDGSGRLQMQAPVLLHDPVLHLLSSHGRECTFNDPSNKEITMTAICINSILMDILRFRDRKRENVDRDLRVVKFSSLCLVLKQCNVEICERAFEFKQRCWGKEIIGMLVAR